MIYYTYIYAFEPMQGNLRYTPWFNFHLKFPQLKWVCEMKDELIPEDKIVMVNETDRFGYRLGVFEYDLDKLTALGLTTDDLTSKASKLLGNFDLEVKTNAEVLEWVKKWTTLEEVSPNKFLLAPACEIPGMEAPAKYLDLN